MRLLDALLGQPLGKNVGHGLGRESDGEGELLVVTRHGGDVLEDNFSARCSRYAAKTRTKSLGISTSMGLSGRPKTETISRIRSER